MLLHHFHQNYSTRKKRCFLFGTPLAAVATTTPQIPIFSPFSFLLLLSLSFTNNKNFTHSIFRKTWKLENPLLNNFSKQIQNSPYILLFNVFGAVVCSIFTFPLYWVALAKLRESFHFCGSMTRRNTKLNATISCCMTGGFPFHPERYVLTWKRGTRLVFTHYLFQLKIWQEVFNRIQME